MTPKALNDSIALALSSPVGLFCFLVVLVAVAVVATWLVRGYFDKFVTWKALQAQTVQEQLEDRSIHEDLARTVETNGRYAIDEVKKAGETYLRMMEKSHKETADFLKNVSEDLVELAKITRDNTNNVNRLIRTCRRHHSGFSAGFERVCRERGW